MSEEDNYDALGQLMADLQALVDAGLVDEMHEPGEPSRYGLSPLGAMLASAIRSERASDAMPFSVGQEFRLAVPDACPVCGATEGYDGIAECLRCRVLSSPDKSARAPLR